ncbi:helix-turn-helix domain-containing protein [Alkalihalobacillus pseudalcaliphilus]|uniref:helix-turn-helix domain-containing protein n=1 Tax=Alkalihalobacillus pseudalcaliphilus TaxID=79884 RepID=UPI00064E0002|nr:helix-turn-helix transcriptional regulator [Alkalihalobacillus pseudalcaliphilus]KMK78039.1 hypothetical protein AB990_00880 [Alkalihalobacillus pseudalcaliphilus]
MKTISKNLLGQRLKEIRQQKGLTQSKLAKGICTQAQISNLEREDSQENPTSYTLYLLSERLGVSMGYLYGQTSHEETHHSNLDSIKEIVTNLKNRRDYISLKYVIDNELKNVHSLTNVDKQYLYWHEAIYIYYLETDFALAEKKLKKALSLRTDMNNATARQQLIETKISYGIILSDEDKYEEAENMLFECFEASKEGENFNFHLYAKILFNISTNLTKQKKYQQSIEYCLISIEHCINKGILYTLGDSLYQTGFNYHQIKDLENGRKYMEQAKLIFEIQKNYEMVKFIEEKLKNLYI